MIAAIPAAAQELLIPAAGAVQGIGGTFFRSDITLFNHHSTTQRVTLRWLPQVGGQTIPPLTFDISPSSAVSSEDFVTNVLHVSGLGSILVQPVDQNGNPVLGSGISATSRIWSPGTNGNGTVSQSFPAIPTATVNSDQLLLVLGQRLDDRFRTNVGIVNLDPTQTLEFDIFQNTNDSRGSITTHVVVPPMTMQQIGLPFAAVPVLDIGVQVRTPANATKWIAYGSSVDNVTGDSWSNIGTKLP